MKKNRVPRVERTKFGQNKAGGDAVPCPSYPLKRATNTYNVQKRRHLPTQQKNRATNYQQQAPSPCRPPQGNLDRGKGGDSKGAMVSTVAKKGQKKRPQIHRKNHHLRPWYRADRKLKKVFPASTRGGKRGENRSTQQQRKGRRRKERGGYIQKKQKAAGPSVKMSK